MSIRRHAKANQTGSHGSNVPVSAAQTAYQAADFHSKVTNLGSEGQYNKQNGQWRVSNSQFRR